MQKSISVVLILVFIIILPFALIWGAFKGAWQEVEDLWSSMAW